MTLIQKPFAGTRKLLAGLAIAVTASAVSLPVAAQGSQELLDLLKKVENNQTEEAKRNREREAKFKAAASEQVTLQRQAEAEVAKQEALRDELKAKFDENEIALAELQATLDRRTGDLGELFGVFRQMADDTQTALYDSLITVEYPERKPVADELAKSEDVPTIPQMRALWELLLQEIAHSGEVSKFESSIVEPSGENYTAEVTRVGTFNMVSGDKYLNFISDSDQVVELPRQPQGYVRKTAAELSSAGPGQEVGFYLDPSRGALLGLLVQSPSLMERVEQGKTVGYAIIVVGIIGLAIVLVRLLALSRTQARIRAQLKDMDHYNNDNPLGRILNVYYENKHLDLETIKRKLDEVVFRDVSEIRKGLPIVKVLAAVAPLMGLLGTVTGMIGTFQAITLFGTGDPKLMAGGISQALITTVLGLVAAIPLLLSHSILSSRVTAMSKVIGEQSAALMAQKAEADAQLKA
ncbi:MotA/TolQ/ExbB proton channel family protein [Mangrovimicrobium sediminis]|uniref:MotA/TolQ/ExbB proton channel family protein n=1 Tax=Mangrovimicrobium sediminis TaxID=2562682 RepID=A0A4Z0M598_9GAMM|nr:MotA/TolQ/ExbB proton channel family protein [Haliea sp. SAOS-164]TGD74597.1 MotA/TolQ/ExbB proton channel family protein [Haliea sp. SAOS-164]